MSTTNDHENGPASSNSPALPAQRTSWRERRHDHALDAALRKRANGVPTLTVPEAAALLSISPEHLYRLIRTGTFPAVRMGSEKTGRYVIPAKAIDRLLDAAVSLGEGLDAASWAAEGSIGPAR